MKEVRAEGAGADRAAGWSWARDGNMMGTGLSRRIVARKDVVVAV